MGGSNESGDVRYLRQEADPVGRGLLALEDLPRSLDGGQSQEVDAVAVDLTPYEREKAFTSIRENREQIRQGTVAMWLNAAYAAARGATLAQLSDATGVSADIVRRELRRVKGRA